MFLLSHNILENLMCRKYPHYNSLCCFTSINSEHLLGVIIEEITLRKLSHEAIKYI